MRRKTTWLNFRPKKTQKSCKVPEYIEPFHESTESVQLPSDITQALALLHQEWTNCADVKFQSLHVQEVGICVVFINGLVDQDAAQRAVMGPLTSYDRNPVRIDDLKDTLWATMTVETDKLSSVHQAIADGKVVLFVDGDPKALVVDINQMPGRAIERSENEPTIQGPQEAFVESLQTNLALIRKRLRTSKLKVEMICLGTQTHSQVALLYLDGVLKPTLLEEARNRFGRIQTDGIIDSNQIREMMSDAPLSPFRMTEITERPDRVLAGLLQGQLFFFFDGSANIISVPTVFVSGLISSEDYYGHYMITLPLRLLRHVMYWTSLLLPSLYVALLSYNQDLIPTPLLISLGAQHEGIPFPTVVEALGMQVAFEALREAGLRLPRAVGQSVSIVGALIIGDAAVNANIVSPGMVIVVAAAGVASYTIPSQDLVSTNRVLQFPFMIVASLLGLYGIVTLGLVLVIHMVSLRSFGVPYMAPLAPFSWSEMRDTFFRAPWWAMNLRPELYESANSARDQTPRPSPPSGDTP